MTELLQHWTDREVALIGVAIAVVAILVTAAFGAIQVELQLLQVRLADPTAVRGSFRPSFVRFLQTSLFRRSVVTAILIGLLFISTGDRASIAKLDGSPDPTPALTLGHCQNNWDDDGDAKIDFPNDPGCDRPEDNTESPDPALPPPQDPPTDEPPPEKPKPPAPEPPRRPATSTPPYRPIEPDPPIAQAPTPAPAVTPPPPPPPDVVWLEVCLDTLDQTSPLRDLGTTCKRPSNSIRYVASAATAPRVILELAPVAPKRWRLVGSVEAAGLHTVTLDLAGLHRDVDVRQLRDIGLNYTVSRMGRYTLVVAGVSSAATFKAEIAFNPLED